MATVVMHEYDPGWPALFEDLRKRIAAALGPLVIDIEHIGSTSVPNLCAKPIIDLDVIVEPENLPAAIAAVEALGYRHEGNLGVDGREAFRWTAEFPEHHLYVCPKDSPALGRHLLFRDFLRTHPDAARQYAQLKKELAQQFHDDRSKYQDAKTAFIESLVQEAKEAAEQIQGGSNSP
jgi:GrpB-like predicted nucleotidyltransferase (UPF0157 family)